MPSMERSSKDGHTGFFCRYRKRIGESKGQALRVAEHNQDRQGWEIQWRLTVTLFSEHGRERANPAKKLRALDG